MGTREMELAKEMNEDQRKLAQRLLKEGKSVREVALTFSVTPPPSTASSRPVPERLFCG